MYESGDFWPESWIFWLFPYASTYNNVDGLYCGIPVRYSMVILLAHLATVLLEGALIVTLCQVTTRLQSISYYNHKQDDCKKLVATVIGFLAGYSIASPVLVFVIVVFNWVLFWPLNFYFVNDFFFFYITPIAFFFSSVIFTIQVIGIRKKFNQLF